MYKKRLNVRWIIGLVVTLILLSPGALLAAQKPINLKWWVFASDVKGTDYGEFLEEFKKDMLKKHNIDITFEIKEYKLYDELMTTAALAKRGYDIAQDWIGPTLESRGRVGNFLALNKYFPEEEYGDFTSWDSCYVDDNLYAIPYKVNVNSVVYNKGLFRKAGIDPEYFPETWDEFLDLCQKLKNAGITPLVYANKEGFYNELFFNMMGVQNFNSLEEMKEVAGPNGTYSDPRVLDMLRRYKELYDKGYFMEGGMNINFTTGYAPQIVGNQAAINLNGNVYVYDSLKKAQGLENSGLAPFPVFGKGKLKDAITLLAQVYAVAPWTKHPEAAVTVFKELLSVEYQNKALEVASLAPVNPNWDRILVKDPNLKLIYDRISKNSVSNFYSLYTYPVWQALVRYITLYLLGEISAEEATKKMDEAKKE